MPYGINLLHVFLNSEKQALSLDFRFLNATVVVHEVDHTYSSQSTWSCH